MMLKERDSDVDGEKINLKKHLNNEKKKNIELNEQNGQLREELETYKNTIMGEMLEKD